MPYYTYKCDTCDHSAPQYQKIADRDVPVGQECGFCPDGLKYRAPEVPGFTTSESLGRIKAPQEFRDLLSSIKKQNPGSVIPER